MRQSTVVIGRSNNLERVYKDFFPKFLGKTDFLRGQELTANCTLVEILMSLKLYKDFFLKFLGKTDFLRGQELTANCTLVEILMSLKLCLEF